MPTVDVGRDAAQEAARHELAKPIYPRASITDRAAAWFDDLFYRIEVEASSVPGGWLTVTVLVLLLVAALVVAARVAMRTTRSRRAGDTALFQTGGMTAEQHRATAHARAAGGDWAAAIQHRLRAIARTLEETAVLTSAPGRTATELGRDAGAVLPALSNEFHCAADTFNDVTYGGQPGSEQGYRQIVDLDEHLRTRATTLAPAALDVARGAGWAEVG